jgi:hypothetical protein
MAIQISISNAIGSRYRGSVVPPIDPDAQAFITAASITDPTQQAAINTLVVDLKGYNIWSKMKALYPFVGSTASQHKWNLKDPRDLDAAFRITWSGGITHNSNGVTFGGVNGFGNTYLSPSLLPQNSNSQMFYNRVLPTTASYNGTNNFHLGSYSNGTTIDGSSNSASSTLVSNTFNGLMTYIRRSSGQSDSLELYRNAVTLQNNNFTSTTPSTNNYYIGAYNNAGTAALFSTYNLAFASLGDGLTDTEVTNFYTAVQAFQTTLGRSIGTQTVSDADAQAFVTAADIQDQVEANAVNNLVIGMKADGLWTKMKAVYPFVGGTASTMKFNLKNPLDTDAAFRIIWNGGGAWSNTGYTPNGSNGFADTKLNPSLILTQSSKHFSFYLRTDNTPINADPINMGSFNSGGGKDFLLSKRTDQSGMLSDVLVTNTQTNPRGFSLVTRTATTNKLFKGNTLVNTASGTGANGLYNTYIGALNFFAPYGYTNNEFSFASIGDGLTDTDATNLNTRVTTFQTALSRNI